MGESPSAKHQTPIFLLGFMASGKTTVGRALATQLNIPFIDLDEEIIQSAGKTIADIIRQEGEPYFRQLETNCLQQAAQKKAVVIALGGGAFTQAANRDVVAQTGISIWLDAPFDVCWQRIQSDSVVRPLAPTKEETLMRYQARIPIYRQACFHISVTAAATPTSLVEQILTHLH